MSLNVTKLSRELHVIPDINDTFFRILFAVANLSNGSRRQGAILVKDGNIISTGCFDTYATIKNEKDNEQREIGSGAIENCIASCAKRGTSTNGSILYVYALPNLIQCKLLSKAGIVEIHCQKDVQNSDAHKVCIENNIKVFVHQQKN